MIGKKKTPGSAATLTGAEQETACEARSSCNYSTTSGAPGQKVSDYLLHGQENAVPMRHLKDLLHLDRRTVRLMIRRERLDGVPICEDSKTGYFLPGNVRERDLCAKRLRHRAAEVIKVADAIAAADIEGAADLD